MPDILETMKNSRIEKNILLETIALSIDSNVELFEHLENGMLFKIPAYEVVTVISTYCKIVGLDYNNIVYAIVDELRNNISTRYKVSNKQ